MTAERVVHRVSSSWAFGGFFLIVVAIICAVTGGSGSSVVQSVRHVGETILAAIGAVCIGVAFALAQPAANDQSS